MQAKKHSMNRPDEIEAYISDFRRRFGVSPTMQEIADHFELCKSTVYKHLKNMEQVGRIISQGCKRGYLTKAPLIEVPEVIWYRFWDVFPAAALFSPKRI